MARGAKPKPAGTFEFLVDTMVEMCDAASALPTVDELISDYDLPSDMAEAAHHWASRKVKDKGISREIPVKDFFVPENGFSPIATMQEVEDGVFRFVHPSGIQFPRDLTEFFSQKR